MESGWLAIGTHWRVVATQVRESLATLAPQCDHHDGTSGRMNTPSAPMASAGQAPAIGPRQTCG